LSAVQLKYYRTGINKSLFAFTDKKIPYGNKDIKDRDTDPIDLARFRTHFQTSPELQSWRFTRTDSPRGIANELPKKGFNEDQWGEILRMK
jgi:hypothetical protein